MQFKKTTVALSLLAVFSLVGCGSDSAENDDPGAATYTITAIDGYLESAYIYADCNDDGIADSSDALGTTDSDGKLAISTDYQTCSIIVKAVKGETKDTGTTIENDYEMIAESGSEVITPFTTLAAVYDVTIAQLAADLGYDEDVISGDFIAKAADSNDNNVDDAQKAALLASTMTSVFKGTVRSNSASKLLAATQATQSVITTLAADESIPLTDVTIDITDNDSTEDNDSSSVTASISVESEGETKEISSSATAVIDSDGGVTRTVATTINGEESEPSDSDPDLSINPGGAFTDSLASYVNNRTWYGSYLYGFNKDYVREIAFDSDTGSYTKNGDAAGDYSVSDSAVTFNGDESSFFYYSEKLLVSVGETNTIFWSSENIAEEIDDGTFEPEEITESYISGKTFYALWNNAADETEMYKWVLNTDGSYAVTGISDASFSDTGTWSITNTNSGLLKNNLSLLNFKSDSDEYYDFSVIALVANDDLLATLEYSVPDEEGDTNRFNNEVKLFFTDKAVVESIYKDWLKTQSDDSDEQGETDSTNLTDSLASYIDGKTWYIYPMDGFDKEAVTTVSFDSGASEYTRHTEGSDDFTGDYTIQDNTLTIEGDNEDDDGSESSTFSATSDDFLISSSNNGENGETFLWLPNSLPKDAGTLSKDTFSGQTWYLRDYDSSLITLTFTDNSVTVSGEDYGDPWTEEATWEIDGSKLTLGVEGDDAEVNNFTFMNNNVNDVLVSVDTGNTKKIGLFFKNKATADALSEVVENAHASNAYSIPEGKVTFTDKGSIPGDALVRIVPKTYTDADDYSMALICDIDEDGSFGTDCMIESDQKEGFDTVFADQNETYQVVVFKNHIESDENNWNCGEDVYKYVGGSVGSWSSISISDSDYQEGAGETCH